LCRGPGITAGFGAAIVRRGIWICVCTGDGDGDGVGVGRREMSELESESYVGSKDAGGGILLLDEKFTGNSWNWKPSLEALDLVTLGIGFEVVEGCGDVIFEKMCPRGGLQ
jgi:hypothetical protein